ncbi:MAG: chorismate mutase [Candidatus Sabulitectum sp.]|nr:chorismate mutase [Candidatus Sabulitectum sp.]MCK5841874.1 chorismate mutase [Candidatus Sabulitectum sp.]
MNQIDELRKEIDKIDSEIVHQLNRRIELVLSIKDYKKQNKLPVEDIAREEDVISNLEFDKLDEDFVRDIFKTIFSYSKSKQTQ